MAKKRDYRAEYAARKARAQAQGFSSPRKRNPIGTPKRAAQSKKQQQANKRAKDAGFKSDYEYRKTAKQARSSSNRKAMHDSAIYDPATRPLGMTVAQYTQAYNAAWIDRKHGSRSDYNARQYWYEGMWDDYPDSEYPEWYEADFSDRYSD